MYEKNAFGDIIAVYTDAGVKQISYVYDAWGNFTTTYHNGATSSSIAAKNPYKYRGYYYDSEIGLYYLKTRYYDPNVGRFINADGYISTGQGLIGYNMYAYCNNNPIMYVDPQGTSFKEFLDEIKKQFDETKKWVEDKVDKVIDYFSFDEESVVFDDEGKTFNFEDNEDYTFGNSWKYAECLKENYYQDSNRTTEGLYLELQAHYVLYLAGHPSGTNGAQMKEAYWSVDWNAVVFEAIAFPRVVIGGWFSGK